MSAGLNGMLDTLNNLPPDIAKKAFQRCCGSNRWVDQMLVARPFATDQSMFKEAGRIWNSLSPEDWKEAFRHHPPIGDINSLRKRFAETEQWARQEQGGVNEAAEDVLTGLADGNSRYEQKFGYIFIVCATGKSAQEMLKLIDVRLQNDSQHELRIAGGEQEKITRLRLEKMLLE